MKRITLTIIALAGILFGCQQVELADPNDTGAVKMKTVTISAGIDGTDTKASLDSQTGAFTWQSGDLISVLATDGKFYDFILEGEYGTKTAEFKGEIPVGANVTTVATYPRIVANGTENNVLTANTLNYVLPATWTWMKDVSNVPMVATFGEGAEHMSFKQVGGVMRFPVKNLPMEAIFVVTMNDKTITGQFPVDITALGESCMTAGTAASELVINYTSDVDGADAEFNVPVPTGVYNNFTVTIKDAEGNELFTKNYSAENTVNRATLLNMKELVLPERPMVISEVWPFFVDARVVFGKYEGVEKYAFYIDGATEPVIVAAEDLGDKYGALVGGEFAHKSTHTVAVAKVVNGEPVAASKSEAVEFTTGDIRQLTRNTGTKFVAVGWDDVAVDYSPKWDSTKERYSVVLDDGRNKNDRGYQVQLLADDKTTVIYDMIPFNGHCDFEVAFANTTIVGKTNGGWIVVPTALTFGWLEPGKDYYFRVKTLDEVEYIGLEQGNYNPNPSDSKPVPSPIYSARGGSAWSEMVKVSTDPAHVASPNEILYEGFDDMLMNQDYMNWSVAVIPDVTKEYTPISKADYQSALMTGYPEFLQTPASERKFTTEGWHQGALSAEKYGMFTKPYVVNEFIELNEVAGSLEGWSVSSAKSSAVLAPQYGSVRLARGLSKYADVATLRTPKIQSDKLLSYIGTKCIVTIQVSFLANGLAVNDIARTVDVKHIRGESVISSGSYNIQEMYSDKWSYEYLSGGETTADYAHYNSYYEIKYEAYLRHGDQITIAKSSNGKGGLIVGEVKIEVVPGEYEVEVTNPYDTGVGTEPDDTNYDIFGLGEFPITYYHGAPTSAYTKIDEVTGQSYYDYDATKVIYQDVKDAGFNIVTYTGACDYSLEENKRILGICEELDLKFFSAYQGGHTYSMDWISKVKEHLYPSPAYIGDFIRDEPNASEFDAMGAYVKEYLKQMPDKEVYVNLFPEYASSTQLGTTTYEAHINQYLSKVPTKMLGFDYYGVKDWGLDTRFYSNYDIVRTKSLAKRMPYLAITAAGGIGSSQKDPSETELRWQVWASIAMGSKGISYFTYWTPEGDPNLVNNEYMIRRDGTKRDMYYWVKDVNADIKTIGKKLINCHADGAIISYGVTYSLYYNNGVSRTNYGPIQKVRGTDHYLCGCFRDARTTENGENYKGYKALVTNQFPQGGDNSINLTLDLSVAEVTFTHNNTTKTLSLSNNLNESIDTDVTVSYTGGVLTLIIPAGEAVLLEF